MCLNIQCPPEGGRYRIWVAIQTLKVAPVKHLLNRANIFFGIAGMLFVLTASSHAADKMVWKPVPQAAVRVDAHAPKLWNRDRTGKKADPLLLQLGARVLGIYLHTPAVYEIKPEQLEHKGQDL